MFVYEILEATKGILISGNKDEYISSFSQDTRKIEQGGLYIPLKGERFDGHDFIDKAFENGASAIITMKDVNYPDKIVIKVNDTFKALKDMATYVRLNRNVKVVGVTGSVGKTTSRDMIYSVVKQKYKTLKTEGNYNNEIGLPLTILRHKDEKVMVLEMGMNHLQEMSHLSKIALPDLAVITNVGTAHIGELGSRENILKAKLEITDGMKDGSTLIINQDNDMLCNVDIDRLYIIRCGQNKQSEIKAKDIKLNETGSVFTLCYDGKETEVEVCVAGMHNVSNALLAIAVGLQLNIDIESIKEGIRLFELTKNRMDIIEKGNVKIIDGTYNASLDSMKSSLDVLSGYKTRKVAILADMLELGTYSEELHREVGNYVFDKGVDILICVGKEAKYMYDEVKDKMTCYYYENNDDLIKDVHEYLKDGDMILVKGSHSMNLAEVVQAI